MSITITEQYNKANKFKSIIYDILNEYYLNGNKVIDYINDKDNININNVFTIDTDLRTPNLNKIHTISSFTFKDENNPNTKIYGLLTETKEISGNKNMYYIMDFGLYTPNLTKLIYIPDKYVIDNSILGGTKTTQELYRTLISILDDKIGMRYYIDNSKNEDKLRHIYFENNKSATPPDFSKIYEIYDFNSTPTAYINPTLSLTAPLDEYTTNVLYTILNTKTQNNLIVLKNFIMAFNSKDNKKFINIINDINTDYFIDNADTRIIIAFNHTGTHDKYLYINYKDNVIKLIDNISTPSKDLDSKNVKVFKNHIITNNKSTFISAYLYLLKSLKSLNFSSSVDNTKATSIKNIVSKSFINDNTDITTMCNNLTGSGCSTTSETDIYDIITNFPIKEAELKGQNIIKYKEENKFYNLLKEDKKTIVKTDDITTNIIDITNLSGSILMKNILSDNINLMNNVSSSLSSTEKYFIKKNNLEIEIKNNNDNLLDVLNIKDFSNYLIVNLKSFNNNTVKQFNVIDLLDFQVINDKLLVPENVIYFNGKKLNDKDASFNNLIYENKGWNNYINNDRYISSFDNTINELKKIIPCVILYKVYDINNRTDITKLIQSRKLTQYEKDYDTMDYYYNIIYDVNINKEKAFVDYILENNKLSDVLEKVKNNQKYDIPTENDIQLNKYYDQLKDNSGISYLLDKHSSKFISNYVEDNELIDFEIENINYAS